MKKTKKDKISDYAKIAGIVAGAILTAQLSGAALPSWLTIAAGVIATASGGVVAHLTGKDDDGQPKQINKYRP